MVKRALIQVILMAMIVLLAPLSAVARSVSLTDNTWMQPWYGNQTAIAAGYTTWDWQAVPIANPPASNWEINRVDVTWSSGGNMLMQIYTNYPQDGLLGAGQADIALDRNQDGIFETGIKMSGASLGTIYAVSSWKTSQDLWAGTGDIYTGRYDTLGSQADPKTPNTLINQAGEVLGQAEVTWSPASGSGSNSVINILFPQSFADAGIWDNFNFTVASGSCANDILAATASNPVAAPSPAPLPASFLLFASGLLALSLPICKGSLSRSTAKLAKIDGGRSWG